jgi:hypothetical protein
VASGYTGSLRLLAYAGGTDTFIDAVIAAAGRTGLTLLLPGTVLDDALVTRPDLGNELSMLVAEPPIVVAEVDVLAAAEIARRIDVAEGSVPLAHVAYVAADRGYWPVLTATDRANLLQKIDSRLVVVILAD